MVVISNLYKWAIHYNDNNKEIEIKQIQNSRIKKSWEYMYNSSDKETKMLMEKAYINSLKNIANDD
jgi:hypothetical protein